MTPPGRLAVAGLLFLQLSAADVAPSMAVGNTEEADDAACALQQRLTSHRPLAKPGDERMVQGSIFVHMAEADAQFRQTEVFPEACQQSQPNSSAQAEQDVLCAGERKRIPCIYSGLLNRPSQEKEMTDMQKYTFEHHISRSLYTSKVVTETSTEFGNRLFAFVVAGGKTYDHMNEDDSLVAAFGPRCSVNNTGFPGKDPATIKAVLTVNGNVREIWCLFYCLMGNQKWVSNVLSQADESFFVSLWGSAWGQSAWKVTQERRVLVEATQKMPPSDQYTYGIPDYTFPPYGSWVDLSFSSYLPWSSGGAQLWPGARLYVGCESVNFTTADPFIVPPLSSFEITAECEGKTPPCKLHWQPGGSCYNILPGTIYANRTRLNGYRTAAGASATTANLLQFVQYLGFSLSDLLAFRTISMAWLVTSDDHSFIEIMLAAEPWFQEEERLSMQWGLNFADLYKYADFQRIWPKGYTLKTSWGPVFRGPGQFIPRW